MFSEETALDSNISFSFVIVNTVIVSNHNNSSAEICQRHALAAELGDRRIGRVQAVVRPGTLLPGRLPAPRRAIARQRQLHGLREAASAMGHRQFRCAHMSGLRRTSPILRRIDIHGPIHNDGPLEVARNTVTPRRRQSAIIRLLSTTSFAPTNHILSITTHYQTECYTNTLQDKGRTILSTSAIVSYTKFGFISVCRAAATAAQTHVVVIDVQYCVAIVL
mmetsp:Transcript_5699/g.16875  ORF Transcript_5699/g.16875 Transcript_5699/m.16875 type:complete len:221 (-) Transcript_5699:69-731(-)